MRARSCQLLFIKSSQPNHFRRCRYIEPEMRKKISGANRLQNRRFTGLRDKFDCTREDKITNQMIQHQTISRYRTGAQAGSPLKCVLARENPTQNPPHAPAQALAPEPVRIQGVMFFYTPVRRCLLVLTLTDIRRSDEKF